MQTVYAGTRAAVVARATAAPGCQQAAAVQPRILQPPMPQWAMHAAWTDLHGVSTQPARTQPSRILATPLHRGHKRCSSQTQSWHTTVACTP
eukprot:365578-Chlamydomonas_euryale.AAC.6